MSEIVGSCHSETSLLYSITYFLKQEHIDQFTLVVSMLALQLKFELCGFSMYLVIFFVKRIHLPILYLGICLYIYKFSDALEFYQ